MNSNNLMLGTEYSKNPEILLNSFVEMNKSYKRVKRSKNTFIVFLESLYIGLFGIPEIGFQLRGMYFQDAIKQVKARKIESILDAGSGIGYYSLKLAEAYPRATVTSGEIDQNKLSFAKQFSDEHKGHNARFIVLDITKTPKKPNQYNFIVNIDVLEHIENYKQALKNFSHMLAKRGYLYLHTPQPNQTRIFKSLKKWHHDDHVHEGYLPSDLERELNALGFKIISIRETFGFFGKMAWELNHLSFKKGLIVSGIFFPFLYLLASLDMLFPNKHGLGTAILAQKT